MNVYPTGTCFDDAVEFLAELVLACPALLKVKDILLVHAICINPQDGERFAHGWVEMGEHAIFSGILEGARKPARFTRSLTEHYEALRPRQVTKYTPLQMLRENKKHGTYGPWKKKYLDLCRQHGEPRDQSAAS